MISRLDALDVESLRVKTHEVLTISSSILLHCLLASDEDSGAAAVGRDKDRWSPVSGLSPSTSRVDMFLGVLWGSVVEGDGGDRARGEPQRTWDDGAVRGGAQQLHSVVLLPRGGRGTWVGGARALSGGCSGRRSRTLWCAMAPSGGSGTSGGCGGCCVDSVSPLPDSAWRPLDLKADAIEDDGVRWRRPMLVANRTNPVSNFANQNRF